MLIEKINIYKIRLPFRGDFSISRLKAISSDSVILEIIADGGQTRGYGECLPIEFVTGTTVEQIKKDVEAFVRKDTFPWEINDIYDIWYFVDSIPAEKVYNPVVCGLEVSLLDALGISQNTNVLNYLPQDFYTDKIYYGATITLGDKHRISKICELIKGEVSKNLRIKFNHNIQQNKVSLETVISLLGQEYNLRVDPNCVWNYEIALEHMFLIEDFNIKIVEQPMMPNDPDIGKLAKLLKSRGVLLMADESACDFEEIQEITKKEYYQIINVKLSKCGGFRRSLNIIDSLRRIGMDFQIGCALGESGILSAAGRALCLLCRDALYYDGSYDRFLLRENVTSEHVGFGPGGEAGPLDGPGLGVKVDTNTLERLSGGHYFTIYKP